MTHILISLLVFCGMVAYIFAIRTFDSPFWFLFYTLGSSACFSLAVMLMLD